MAITQEVYKTHRFVPLQAKRAVNGEPDCDHPDVDDRGFLTPEFGPVVSVTQGKTVTVRLTRKRVDAASPLTVISSDPSIVVVTDPADGVMPKTENMDIKINGVDGGDDRKDAKLQVQFGDKGSAVTVFELHVWVFKEVPLEVTPHRMTINGGGTPGVAPVADIPKIMEKVQAIWGHYGIKINVHPTVARTVSCGTVNSVDCNPFDGTGEVSRLLNTDHVPGTINAYFVGQIGDSDPNANPNSTTLGLGISPATATGTTPPISHPGIILADGGPGFARGYVMHWANDLAHEMGHFFTLQHVENAQIPDEREDSWSRRILMNSWNELRDVNPFPDGKEQFRPRFTEAGYGMGQNAGRRGCMVTLKHLPQLSFDAEALTARAVIQSKAGPY